MTGSFRSMVFITCQCACDDHLCLGPLERVLLAEETAVMVRG